MKQSLAAVLTGFQSLGSDDSRERPVDRLAALGAIQIARYQEAARSSFLASLGVDLVRFKWANCASGKAPSEEKLAYALSWPSWKLHLTEKQRDLIAKHALIEWALDICPACSGAKQVPAYDERPPEGTQPMRPCNTCSGTGKRRYSDSERFKALGADYGRAMSVAHGLIGRAEDLMLSGTKAMLERW